MDDKNLAAAQVGGRAHTLFFNSLLLCLSAVLMRVVGVSFNVYVSNRVGAEAMGLYSLIMSVFGFALTLANSGINLAVTRCVAEAGGRFRETREVMRRSFLLALFFGSLSAVLLLLLAPVLSLRVLGEDRVLLPLRLCAVSLPAIAVTGVLSGYFSAVRRVWKSAAAQLSEQAVKIYATAALLTLFLPRGPEFACCALVLGCAAADLTSCLLSFLLYLSDKRKLTSPERAAHAKHGRTTGRLLSISMPVALSAYVRSGLTTLEHLLIPIGLSVFGGSRSDALERYGVLNAMVLPVVLFPYAFIYSFTGLLVPEVAGAVAEHQRRRISYIASRMWRLTVLFGLTCAAVMSVCSGELGQVLYGSRDAADDIRMLAPLLPVMYLDTVTDALLKGIGEQVFTMFVNIIDAGLSVLLVWLLLPRFGIRGYIAVLYISELINFAFSASRLFAKTRFSFDLFRWLFLPLVCTAAVSRLICRGLALFPLASLPGWAALAVHIAGLLLALGAAFRLSGAVDREYASWIKKALSGKE